MGTGPAQTESSDRKARERKKANQIRTDYQARQTRDPRRTEGPAAGRATGAAMNRSTQLTRGQSAAGARAAGMAQNLSSIEELKDRRSDAYNPVSKYNLTKQIEALGRGGVPVTTKKSGGGKSKYGGETLTVGVVSGGRYQGRRAYDPARGGTGKSSTEGFYTVKNKVALSDAMTSNAGVDPNDPNRLANRQRNSSKAAADAASKNIVTVKGDGLTASQRAAASGAGAAARRKFLGNVR